MRGKARLKAPEKGRVELNGRPVATVTLAPSAVTVATNCLVRSETGRGLLGDRASDEVERD